MPYINEQERHLSSQRQMVLRTLRPNHVTISWFDPSVIGVDGLMLPQYFFFGGGFFLWCLMKGMQVNLLSTARSSHQKGLCKM